MICTCLRMNLNFASEFQFLYWKQLNFVSNFVHTSLFSELNLRLEPGLISPLDEKNEWRTASRLCWMKFIHCLTCLGRLLPLHCCSFGMKWVKNLPKGSSFHGFSADGHFLSWILNVGINFGSLGLHFDHRSSNLIFFAAVLNLLVR